MFVRSKALVPGTLVNSHYISYVDVELNKASSCLDARRHLIRSVVKKSTRPTSFNYIYISRQRLTVSYQINCGDYHKMISLINYFEVMQK